MTKATEKKTTDKSAATTKNKPAAKKMATSTKKAAPKASTGKKPDTITTKKKTTTKTTPTSIAKKPPTKMTKSTTAQHGPSGFTPYKQLKDEEYMGEQQRHHFERLLGLWKQQLSEDQLTKKPQGDANNFPDPLDRAALEEEHTLEWRALERQGRLIGKINQALMNMKQGDYGFCEACGADIGIRRLEARPTATQCIDCKTIEEIREKQNRGIH